MCRDQACPGSSSAICFSIASFSCALILSPRRFIASWAAASRLIAFAIAIRASTTLTVTQPVTSLYSVDVRASTTAPLKEGAGVVDDGLVVMGHLTACELFRIELDDRQHVGVLAIADVFGDHRRVGAVQVGDFGNERPVLVVADHDSEIAIKSERHWSAPSDRRWHPADERFDHRAGR